MELSIDEAVAIKRTWEIARKDLTNNGKEILIAYFEMYPHKQALFKRFGRVPGDRLKFNRAFIAQSLALMSAFDGIILTIDEPDVMREKHVQLGRYHWTIKAGVQVEDFVELSQLLLNVFPTMMAEEWNEDAQQGWNKLMGIMRTNVAIELDTSQ